MPVLELIVVCTVDGETIGLANLEVRMIAYDTLAT